MIAHSSASAPELVKNTLSAKVASVRRLAKRFLARDLIEVRQVPDLVGLRPSERSTRCGWAWPSELTATPAPKSRYRSPSSVISQTPSPRSNRKGARSIGVVERRGFGHGAYLLRSTACCDGRCQLCWTGAEKIKNAALRRQRHYCRFALRCQQKPGISRQCSTVLTRPHCLNSVCIAEMPHKAASWGKPEKSIPLRFLRLLSRSQPAH